MGHVLEGLARRLRRLVARFGRKLGIDADRDRRLDLLFGTRAIARFMNLTKAQARNLAATRAIPCFRLGGVICARQGRLAHHLHALETASRLNFIKETIMTPTSPDRPLAAIFDEIEAKLMQIQQLTSLVQEFADLAAGAGVTPSTLPSIGAAMAISSEKNLAIDDLLLTVRNRVLRRADIG